MKKIGDVTSTATPAGEFTNGNVAAGIAPTILEGEWFNALQREVLNVLLKANIKQDPEVDDQLTQAILKLAGTALGGKIKQTLGNSTTDVVSQNTVTEEVNKKLDKTSILQTTGNATDKVMSQDAVTKALQNAVNINTLYPVGVVIWFAQNKNPNTLFPDTKWQYLGENKTIRLAKADGSNVLTSGGADAIKLTEAQLPAHGHPFSATTSSYDYGTKNTNATGEHAHNYTNKSESKRASGDGWNVASGRNVNATTSSSGNHVHTLWLGPHTHTVSGTTGKAGGASEINITNAFVTLMGWYRIS
ncbi:phage baseplate protein [Arsenophonus nasoniae]|uniref:Baseplate structural protein Gp10 C-terminal domain-containing protein n=1 Tax=Arsenophonus nasoniae TaxID=638 RepID=A0AA95GPZ6_9GAMM|nr:hypothetical protein [Arsenophonus nasoniae]WGM00946.1 hypothetical protein QE210_13990 [Arsenophonus nasoniae]